MPIPYNAVEIAAEKGDIKIIETLLLCGFVWLPSAVDIALDNGHKEVFFYAEERGLDIAWFSRLRMEVEE